MGHPCKNIEDGADEGDLNCGYQAEEMLEGKNINKWPREHFVIILQRM